jgi:hypothetical protein
MMIRKYKGHQDQAGVRFYQRPSLDAQMGHGDLKAHTLREALAAARATLRTCSPQDASRLDAVLSAP